MELGEKIRLARQELGLSQRQLCGQEITRNMLSLIEHGSARPSMDTLRYLASRLGKPVSYFLEEEAVVSANQDCMFRARNAWAGGNWDQARLLLENFQGPDPIFDWEYRFLRSAAALAAAENALEKGKELYARQLLEEAGEFCRDFPGMARKRLLLLGRVKNADLAAICRNLPDMDEELLLRARAALEADPARAETLLDAMEHRDTPRWHFFRGCALLNRQAYTQAAVHFSRAEESLPEQVIPLLEQCYRELGDFRRAYEYALKQR